MLTKYRKRPYTATMQERPASVQSDYVPQMKIAGQFKPRSYQIKKYPKKYAAFLPKHASYSTTGLGIPYIKLRPTFARDRKGRAYGTPYTQTELTKCGIEWAQVLRNPFKPDLVGICMPADMLPLPTMKIRSSNSYVITTTAAGDMFFVVAPTAANDVAALLYGNAGIAIVTSNTFTAQIALGAGTFSLPTLPFTSAVLTSAANNLAARIVTWGLRLTYIGPSQTCGGVAYCYEQPQHANLGGMSIDSMTSQDETSRVPILPNNSSGVFGSGPKANLELQFNTANYPISNQSAAGNSYIGAVYMKGLPASSACILIELVEHVEFVGQGTYGATMNKVGSKDLSHGNTAANKNAETNTPSTKWEPIEGPPQRPAIKARKN